MVKITRALSCCSILICVEIRSITSVRSFPRFLTSKTGVPHGGIGLGRMVSSVSSTKEKGLLGRIIECKALGKEVFFLVSYARNNG